MAGIRAQRAREEAELLRLEAERTAQRKQAVAQRKAEQAAAASAAIGARGSGLDQLNTLAIQTRLAIYNAASENLYPILMMTKSELERDEPADYGGVALTDIFTRKLSFVCDLVFGTDVRQALAARYTTPSKSPTIRDFFELEPQTPQCNAVIGTKVLTNPCWLCSIRLGLAQANHQCEHKLPLLPALLVTGLYDRRLHAYLVQTNRAADYMALLGLEYGWSHARCNQLKSDDSFLTPRIDDRTKVVTFINNDAGINDFVSTLFTSLDYERSYTPTLAVLTRDVGDIAGARQMSTTGIQDGLRPLVEKLNRKQFTAKQLMSHFIRGMTNRVIELAPDQVRSLRVRLTPEQVRRVETRLAGRTGGRRRTRSNRRGTYRRQRGGDDDADELISRYIFDRVKEAGVRQFEEMTFQALAADVLTDGSSDNLFQAVETFAKRTDEVAFDIAGDPTMPPSVAEFETWLTERLQTGAPSGTMRRTRSALAQMSSPLPPAVAAAPPEATGKSVSTGVANVQAALKETLLQIIDRLPDDDTDVNPGIVNAVNDVVPGTLPISVSPPASRVSSFGSPPSSERSPTKREAKKLLREKAASLTDSTQIREVIGIFTPPRGTMLQFGGFALGKRPDWL
jgi:hypothetical protein